MRFWPIVAVLAVAAPASAQQGSWGAFQDGSGFGVGVQGADGNQLMLKCDKPGKGSVYVAVATARAMVPPAPSFVMRPVKFRYDDKPPFDDRWRFYTNTAAAVDKGAERSLTQFMLDLPTAKTVELLLYWDTRNPVPITTKFDVTGAKTAIDQVFAKCQDTVPAA
jgi:hypothetical protein